MPVIKPSVKGFTHQDFLDGKCTKEGFPLGTQVIDEKPLAPEVPVTPTEQVVVDPPNDQNDSPEPEGTEAPAEGEELPKEGE